MKKHRIVAIILTLAMIGSMLTGCSSGTETNNDSNDSTVNNTSSDTKQSGEDTGKAAVDQLADMSDKKIALSSQHLGNQFNQGILEGVTAQAEAYGFELVTANAQSDTAQQVSDLENFVEMGVDAIIIGGGEGAAFENVMKKMKEKDIYCITIDMASDYADCNICSDNFNGGEQLALAAKNMLGGKGNILICDTPGWLSLEIRIRMLEAVIEDYPNMEIVHTISIGTEDAINNYQKEVKAYLQGNPDIQWIFCSWGLAAVGASQAVRELGMTDDIIITCVDADQVVLEEMQLEDSPLKIVVGQYPTELGSGAVDLCATALSSGKLPTEAYAPIILITKEEPDNWFSAPAIMTTDEAWNVLYPEE